MDNTGFYINGLSGYSGAAGTAGASGISGYSGRSNTGSPGNAANSSGSPSTSLSTTETLIGSVTITPTSANATIMIFARVDLQKDANTSVRIATGRIRRGSTNTDTQISVDSTRSTSNPGAAGEFYGPLVLLAYDAPATTGATTYGVFALVSVGASTALRYEITAVEIAAMGQSGYSGAVGAQGPSGGVSGASGYSGTSGTSGRSGYSGAVGTGTSGFSGRSGYSGAIPVPVVAAAVTITNSGGTVATNAALGNTFKITLTAGTTHTFSAPTNPSESQRIVYQLRQPSSGGSATISWNAAFRFSAATAPTLTATNSKTDYLTFVYNAVDSKWDCVGERFNF